MKLLIYPLYNIYPLFLVPVHLLVQAELYKSARKRRLGMIPPTPGPSSSRANSTIATPTPSKKRKVALQARMNSTMDSLGSMNAFASSSSNSSLSFKAPSLETIPDDDAMSDVSSIRAGNAGHNTSQLNSSVAMDSSQMRQVGKIRFTHYLP